MTLKAHDSAHTDDDDQAWHSECAVAQSYSSQEAKSAAKHVENRAKQTV